MVENLFNLSSQGTFKQHIEIKQSGNDALLQYQEKIKVINREAHYERNPEQMPFEVNVHQFTDQLSKRESTVNNYSATLKKLPLKIDTISPSLKLSFAIVDSKKKVVSSSVITVALEGLCQKSSHLPPSNRNL